MTFFRKKEAPAPVREPHPDPGIEARLLRIIAMRESAARKGDLAEQYAQEISELAKEFRYRASHGYFSPAEQLKQRHEKLQADIRQLEEEISALHAEIAVQVGELSEFDLSHL